MKVYFLKKSTYREMTKVFISSSRPKELYLLTLRHILTRMWFTLSQICSFCSSIVFIHNLTWICGKKRIRTFGSPKANGSFQDCCLKPLGHLSNKYCPLKTCGFFLTIIIIVAPMGVEPIQPLMVIRFSCHTYFYISQLIK